MCIISANVNRVKKTNSISAPLRKYIWSHWTPWEALGDSQCSEVHALRTAALESNSTPLQYSRLVHPMDGGAWQAAVHGVAKGRTRLSNFTVTFHFHALEKELATHSSVLAWSIPGTAEPGGLPAVCGVAQSRTRLKRLSSSSSARKCCQIRYGFLSTNSYPERKKRMNSASPASSQSQRLEFIFPSFQGSELGFLPLLKILSGNYWCHLQNLSQSFIVIISFILFFKNLLQHNWFKMLC